MWLRHPSAFPSSVSFFVLVVVSFTSLIALVSARLVETASTSTSTSASWSDGDDDGNRNRYSDDGDNDGDNADFHIFNALHSSTRQWGSSWFHNGMSFFRATVPAGTELYHGTLSENEVVGMEWLAFEPEHAILFARPLPPPGGRPRPPGEGRGKPTKPTKPPGKRPPPPPRDHHKQNEVELQVPAREEPNSAAGALLESDEGVGSSLANKELIQRSFQLSLDHSHDGNEHEGEDKDEPGDAHEDGHEDRDECRGADRGECGKNEEAGVVSKIDYGYLHTYRPKHDLNLLYIDGLSAGKSSKGTVDSQDYILINRGDRDPTDRFWDYPRAISLCNISHTRWSDRVDGFLRTEGGFEIILCDFEKHVELTQVEALAVDWDKKSGHSNIFDDPNWGFRYIEAVAARYHGIGGGRVVVDYDSMVSAFDYKLDLWGGDDNQKQGSREEKGYDRGRFPRLQNISQPDLAKIRADVYSMVMNTGSKVQSSSAIADWQGVADLIVGRYSILLRRLVSKNLSTVTTRSSFRVQIDHILRPFVDDKHRNVTEEVERCSEHFMPAARSSSSHLPSPVGHSNSEETKEVSLPARSVRAVSHSICSTLNAASRDRDFDHAVRRIERLISKLDWTVWRECPTCGLDELCAIPIWPWGSVEDGKRPRCRNVTSMLSQRSNYWRDQPDSLSSRHDLI